MKRLRGVDPAICCVCLCLSACESRTTETPAPHFEKVPFGTVHAAPSPERPEIIFSERSGGVAQIVAKDDRFQVVHGGRAGKLYVAIGEVVLSPDGRRCAYGAVVDGKWHMVVDGKEGAPFDSVATPVFSPDGSHVAYPAMLGERWHLVVDSTVNRGTATRYLAHAFSADSTRIAFVDEVNDEGAGRLVVSDLAFKRETVVARGVSTMLLNAARSRLAAVAGGGEQHRIVTLRLDKPDEVLRGAEYFAVSDPVFGPDGVSLAYVAKRAGVQLVVMDEKEAPVVGHVIGSPVVVPGRKALGALMASFSGSVLLREFFAEDGPREATYEEAEGLVYSRDGRRHAYAARRGASWFVVLNGKEGPPFDRVVSPVFSVDGRSMAYRARKAGKRFVVVADTTGGAVSMHAAHEQVFPVQFTPDGKSIAYGVKDGQQLAWQVEAP